ncbi:hypothetical protein [Thalassomonas sp. RHCl1]|uniref:hypothetical protein n=1 Tax=Thalassomonas sp. RHCl1 TaxID=2995320 RepID=UPI00248CC609|nr:hypothetical protein [Thalassomonas sp. RHCl1]
MKLKLNKKKLVNLSEKAARLDNKATQKVAGGGGELTDPTAKDYLISRMICW